MTAAIEWEANISTLVADDSDLAEYVLTLEESKDSNVTAEDNGEILAREVERFLRRQLNVEGDSESQT